MYLSRNGLRIQKRKTSRNKNSNDFENKQNSKQLDFSFKNIR